MAARVCHTHSDLRLLENDAFLGVHSTRQEARDHGPDVLPQQYGGLERGQGVEVHDAVQHTIAAALQLHPVPQGSQIVAEMGHARRLDP